MIFGSLYKSSEKKLLLQKRMSGDGLAHIPGKLPELLDIIKGEGPNLTNEESERILKGLADAAREQDSRDMIIESHLVIDRNVFRLLFALLSWFLRPNFNSIISLF